jgi:hypothetical protein
MRRRVQQAIGWHHAVLARASHPAMAQVQFATQIDQLRTRPSQDNELISGFVSVATMVVRCGEGVGGVQPSPHFASLWITAFGKVGTAAVPAASPVWFRLTITRTPPNAPWSASVSRAEEPCY